MGWNPFESEEVTTVGTAIVRMVEDRDIVNSTKLGVLNGIVSNEDVVDHILEATASNVAAKANNAYRYGKKSAPYGMPAGTFYGNSIGIETVTTVLNAIEGQDVFVEYCRVGPMNRIHLAWQTLIASHGYDPDTNKLGGLTASKKKDVYLADMVMAMPKATYDSYAQFVKETWNKPANAGGIPDYRLDKDTAFLPYDASPAIIRNKSEAVVVTYAYKVTVAVEGEYSWNLHTKEEYRKDSFEFSLPSINSSGPYYQVKYVVGSKTKYWSYMVGSGNHPEIDTLLNDLGEVSGEYFPNIYFRLSKTNLSANKKSDRYMASVKLAKYFGIDYQSLVDQIHKNPDIGNVEQAFMTLGIPAKTTDRIEVKYLYEYLNSQYQAIANPSSNTGFNPSGYLNALWNNDLGYVYSVELKDAAFKMQFLHGGIYKRRVVGKIGAKGTYASAIENKTLQKKVFYSFGEFSDGSYLTSVPYKLFVYKKQVGLNFYDEISIINPAVKYFIYGKYTNIVGDENKELILVPIDRSVLAPMASQEKEYLISRGMHLVFNSRVVTEVAWYQSGWFGDLLQIAAIVITVYSLFTGNGAGLAIATALQTGAYALAINLIVTGLVKYILVQEAFKLFVKAVGTDAAFLLAIAAIAYGSYEQIKAGTVKLTATAKEFLTLANGMMSGANAVLSQDFKDLMGEFKELELLKEESRSALESAEDLLSPSPILQPFALLGESPDSYYRRTVHSGNIGMAAIDDVHNFYERSLMLPRYA